MTLKEKFIDAFKSGKRFDIQNAVQIAEEFAIGFAEWLQQNTIYNGSEYYVYIGNSQQYKLNKLLEIYKNK